MYATLTYDWSWGTTFEAPNELETSNLWEALSLRHLHSLCRSPETDLQYLVKN